MAGWRKTIDIKKLINRDPENIDPAYVAALGEEVAALLLRETTEEEKTFGLMSMIEAFEDIDPTDENAVGVFNNELSNLYDWADDERIWLGL